MQFIVYNKDKLYINSISSLIKRSIQKIELESLITPYGLVYPIYSKYYGENIIPMLNNHTVEELRDSKVLERYLPATAGLRESNALHLDNNGDLWHLSARCVSRGVYALEKRHCFKMKRWSISYEESTDQGNAMEIQAALNLSIENVHDVREVFKMCMKAVPLLKMIEPFEVDINQWKEQRKEYTQYIPNLFIESETNES